MNTTNVIFFFVLLFCLFIFAGGIHASNIYNNNLPVSVSEARQMLTAPFEAGFLMFGAAGLIYVANHAREKGKVLLGFTYVIFSYFGVEVLLWTVTK